MRIHIVGALPGKIGGTTILLKQLVDEIKSEEEISLLISDTSELSNIGILGTLIFFLRTLKNTFKSDITSAHVSAKGSVTIVPILLFTSLLFGKSFNFRMFGGVYDKFFLDSSVLVRKIIAFILTNSDLVYLETKHLVEFFSINFPQSKIKHYTNSRNKSLLTPVFRNENKFIYSGAIKHSKGVGLILQVSRKLPEVKFEFYGPVVDSDLIEEISKYNNCTYRGICQPDDMRAVLRECKCLLLPTEHYGEGYPGVIIEAYSVGVPVITTNWQCIPEIVKDQCTGFLIAPGDSNDLVKKIIDVTTMNEEQYNSMKRSCLDYFNKDFDAKVLSDIFLNDMLKLK